MTRPRKITAADILPISEYIKIRADKRRSVVEMKKNRRIEVGPHATFYFETYETMWLQVQEMLYIEKGGHEQLVGELEAYNPLIPQGSELVATVMFEIDEPARRKAVLDRIGGIEDTAFLSFGGETVTSVPEGDVDRTSADGKASSVHFLHFPFQPGQAAKFRSSSEIVIGFRHPSYGHMTVMPASMRDALAIDLD